MFSGCIERDQWHEMGVILFSFKFKVFLFKTGEGIRFLNLFLKLCFLVFYNSVLYFIIVIMIFIA